MCQYDIRLLNLITPYCTESSKSNDDDLAHLCVVCAHGPIAEQRTAGIAELRVRESIVIDFIIPRFDQLQDGLIPVVDMENRVWLKASMTINGISEVVVRCVI